MILENVYSAPALAFFSVLVIGWYVASVMRYRAKLAKLGRKAPIVPYYLPFGVDTLWKTVEVFVSNK
jgi:hypothetical protein